MDAKDDKADKVNCRRCAHYFVTWDKKFPWGCKAFGFKSRSMPSLDVLSSSGIECQQFLPKPRK
jgi:hypothetical protein